MVQHKFGAAHKGKKKSVKKSWGKGAGNPIAKGVQRARADRAKEVRTFGRASDKATGDQLFVIDTEAPAGAAGLCSSKKLLKRNAALRSEEILVPNSNVPTIGLEATKHKTHLAAIARSKKKPRIVKELPRQTQKFIGKLSKKRAEKIKNNAPAPKIFVVGAKDDSYDLWGAGEVPQLPQPEKVQQTARKVGRLIGAAKSRPSAGQLGTLKTVAAETGTHASMVVADPGSSYNPDKEQHQGLIGEALVQEKRRRKIELQKKHITWNRQRVLRSKDPTEMLADDDDDDVDEDEGVLQKQLELEQAEEDIGRYSVGAPVENKKLTVAQRNRQARVKQLKHELAAAKEAKRLRKAEKRLESIGTEVASVVAARERKAEDRESRPLYFDSV